MVKFLMKIIFLFKQVDLLRISAFKIFSFSCLCGLKNTMSFPHFLSVPLLLVSTSNFQNYSGTHLEHNPDYNWHYSAVHGADHHHIGHTALDTC